LSNRYPDTIEIRFKHSSPSNPNETLLQLGNSTSTNLIVELEHIGDYTTQGNINLYIRSGSTYTSTSLSGSHLFDSEFNQLFIERTEFDDDSQIDQNYNIHLLKQKNGVITYNNSIGIYINGSVGSEFSAYNDSWNVDNTLYVAYANNPINTNYFSGYIQETRLWHKRLNDDIKEQHVLNGESYAGNNPTSSYYDLISRIPLNDVDVNIDNGSYINSIHPNKDVNTTTDGYINRATPNGLSSLDYNSSQETYYQYTPDYGPNIYDSNKIEFVSTELLSDLNPDKSVENSNETRYEIPSNKIRIALSPTDIINDDIFAHTGYFSIDDYIGNPEDINRDYYNELETFTNEYWKKYSQVNSAEAYYNILKLFDYSVFQQIKQVLPARGDNLLGILHEPSVLERSKQRLYKSISNEIKTTDIDLKLSVDIIESDIPNDIKTDLIGITNIIEIENVNYTANIINSIPNRITTGLTYKFDLDFDRVSPITSVYNRTNLVWDGSDWVYISNSEQITDCVIEDISSYTIDGYYDNRQYIFDSDVDIYNGSYSSYTTESSEIKRIYTTPTNNRNYNGCKLLDIPNNNYSYPTPDNKPVIEEFDIADDVFNEDAES